MSLFLQVDLPAALTGTLAALCCALLGNFLLLRRQSLLGDAISHTVLPGIVVGFLVFGTRSAGPMLLGAIAAALVAATLIELVKRYGKLEPGAAMGVVFSVMFALGVLLIERAAARTVDLDAECVLYGQLEDVLWLGPTAPGDLLKPSMWSGFPREAATLLVITVVVAAGIALFFKELRITAFDPELASSVGIPAGAVHFATTALVAVAAVASFEAVGSILVVAMLVCPAATARMFTDRLTTQVWLSGVFAVVAGIGGYVLGALAPVWLGMDGSLSAAGMITVLSGALLALAILLAPGHGVVAKRLRSLSLSAGIAREDLLAMLFRLEENRSGVTLTRGEIRGALGGGLPSRIALRHASRRGDLSIGAAGATLTDAGRAEARRLVRTHRLWETYLVRELGLRPDHVHSTAEALEHVTTEAMAQELGERAGAAADPHGKPIPD
ncbi:MAG: metal ABC transporter permease [Phycisphaeraceae bacterium]|nr:metal ABC transporter permease [Phycisphaeraceae bacterium]MCB9848357.1 metal ABC transporter permease [Phycisphaeraceae bacterium]